MGAIEDLKSMSKITDRLYLSDWQVSCNEVLLKKNKIKAIICLNKNKKPKSVMKMYNKLGIKHYFIYIDDLANENISKHMVPAYLVMNEHITKQNEHLLVHCTAGISRSSTIILYYLMRKYILSLQESKHSILNDKSVAKRKIYSHVYDYVKSKRSIINPNHGFQNQLQLKIEKLF